jgi:hypothetical protein
VAGLNFSGAAGRHVVRQLLGAEQRDQHYGNDQHCGNDQHLPGAVEKGTHDVRPVVRAGDALTGRLYMLSGSGSISSRIIIGTSANPTFDSRPTAGPLDGLDDS